MEVVVALVDLALEAAVAASAVLVAEVQVVVEPLVDGNLFMNFYKI
jgi:hypothetical protein